MVNLKSISKKERAEVLMEDMNSKLEVVLEYTSRIPKIEETLKQHGEQLEALQTDVDTLKVGHKIMQGDIKILKDDVGVLKTDMKEVKESIKNKVDRDEFEKHDHHQFKSSRV